MQVPVSARASVPRRRSLVALASAGALTAGAAAVGATLPASAASDVTPIQILSFNDYHGHVQPDTPGSIDGSFRGPAAGGGEYLSAKLAELRGDRAEGETFTVAAGDLIGGSPFFSGLFHDEPAVESLNAMGLDFSGVGNHEFDEGVVELLRMQNGGNHPVDGGYFTDYDPDTSGDQEFSGADFQWLAANVTRDPATAAPETASFETDIPDYSIETAADGKKIAFIGMTLEGTDELVAAAGIAGFSFEDEIIAGNAAVAAIQAEDPDVEAIVVMLHEGGIPVPFAINGCAGISGPIVEIAEGLDAEIDAIVTGHTHLPYTCSINDPENNPRPVTSAFSFGRVITEINLELDADGEVDRDTFEMVNHEVLQNLPTDDPEVTTPAPTDPAVTAILERWTPLAEDIGNDVVGQITDDIVRGGEDGAEDRGVESSAGNLVADAQLEATAGLGAQIAMMNPGGLRSDLLFASDTYGGDGDITYGEAFTFQPFNNTMFVLPMTGAQIISVLEQQCQPGDSSRPVLHLGVSEGFTYDLALTVEAGVCTAVEITNVMLNGTALDEATTYQVAVNGFLADGGDNFETFAEVAPTDRLPGPQDIDALVDYFEANSPVAPPSTDRVNETFTVLPGPIQTVTPGRILETRTGESNVTIDNLFEKLDRIPAGDEVELTVTGRGGVPVDAEAVVLNVGAIQPSEQGFLSIYPCGTERPQASSVNFAANTVVSNGLLAKVGADGAVCIYTSAEAHLIADVQSYVPAGSAPSALDPARVVDTRDADNAVTIDGVNEGEGPFMAGVEVEIQVAGRAMVPEDAAAAVLNVGAIRPAERGFFSVYPCGEDLPRSSSLNFEPGDVVSNATTTGLGTDGKVCIVSSVDTHAIVDVNAYVPAGEAPNPFGPDRLLDTRTGPNAETIDGDQEGAGRLEAGGVIEVPVAGRAGIPADADTVFVNVGAVGASERGFLTVYDCSDERPVASNVNYLGGDVISNSVVAELSDDGSVCVYTSAETHVIVDLTATVPAVVPFIS